MAAWLTIGALDPDEWKSEMGARWTQRAGRVLVEEAGSGFGGRSSASRSASRRRCRSRWPSRVKLDDERGAAGLIFRHDGEKHYGFYPTGGKLRLTRFDGPDVFSWKILHDVAEPALQAGRVEHAQGARREGRSEVLRQRPAGDRVGRRGVGRRAGRAGQVPRHEGGVQRLPRRRRTWPRSRPIAKAVLDTDRGKPGPDLVGKLAKEKASTDVLRARAEELEKQAAKLKELAGTGAPAARVRRVGQGAAGPEEKIDLIHAALLLAKLDNEEVDVDAYRGEVERMAKKAAEGLAKDATDEAKLKALNTFFFEKRGFHGSRGDYYNRSNSYLNEVIDDREGLPITLCVLYMDLARRLGVTVDGVGLPGHFVMRHVPKKGEGKFIDVYEGGER